MIVFYNKNTGFIVGTIAGRTNTAEELKMWIGEASKNDRIIIQWRSTKTVLDAEGNSYETDYEPDHPQAELVKEFEPKPMLIYRYKIDLDTKQFIKIEE